MAAGLSCALHWGQWLESLRPFLQPPLPVLGHFHSCNLPTPICMVKLLLFLGLDVLNHPQGRYKQVQSVLLDLQQVYYFNVSFN